ncbi:MAG: holo-ACP synthase [Rubrivivax sp.]|nr:holo-ACP synthase [Rubrivivax sp.]
MIIGIGTDVCDIRRIAQTLQRRGDRFTERILGPAEMQIFYSRRERAPARGLRFVATRFSAKEAFSKAIGLGIRSPMTWRSCEVLNAPGGKPYIQLSGELKTWFDARGWSAHVTLTDETDYAASFVVVEASPTASGPP